MSVNKYFYLDCFVAQVPKNIHKKYSNMGLQYRQKIRPYKKNYMAHKNRHELQVIGKRIAKSAKVKKKGRQSTNSPTKHDAALNPLSSSCAQLTQHAVTEHVLPVHVQKSSRVKLSQTSRVLGEIGLPRDLYSRSESSVGHLRYQKTLLREGVLFIYTHCYFFIVFCYLISPNRGGDQGLLVHNGDSACGPRLRGFQPFVLIYFHLVVAFQQRFFVGCSTDGRRSVGTGRKRKTTIGVTLQINKVVNNGTANWKILEDMSGELNINQTVRLGFKLIALSVNY